MTRTAPASGAYTWRHLTPQDLGAAGDLIRTVEDHEQREEVTTDDRLAHEYEHDLDDPARDTVLAVARDGAPAALGWVSSNRGGARKWRAILSLYAHPQHRSDALLDELLRRSEKRCREILAGCEGDLPRLIRSWTELDSGDMVRLFERSGYTAARYFTVMRRPVTVPLPEQPLPVGLRLEGWRPDLEEATRLAHNESFADHWGVEPQTAAQWHTYHAGDPNFRSDLSFLALDGNDVVGYALSAIYPEDFPQLGFSEGWTETLGVRPGWRRRGIAAALLTRSLAGFAGEGLDYGSLGVDSDNRSGAIALYAGLGYEAARTSVTWIKHVGSIGGLARRARSVGNQRAFRGHWYDPAGPTEK